MTNLEAIEKGYHSYAERVQVPIVGKIDMQKVLALNRWLEEYLGLLNGI